MALAPKKPSALQTALTLAKQVGAGAVLPFMDNPNIPGQKTDMRGYSPLMVDMVPSAVYNLANMIPGVKLQSGYLDEASQRISLAEERLNTALGIKAPANAAELAANVVGSMIIPGGPAKSLPKVAKAATASARAAQIAKSAGRVAVESVVPLRQGSKLASKTSAAVTALPVVASEIVDAVGKSPEYKGIPEYLGKQEGIADDIDDKYEYEPLDVVEDDQFEYTPLDAAGDDEFEYESLETPEPIWKNPLLKGAAIGAAILGGGIGFRTIQNITKARLSNTSALTGQAFEPQFTKPGTIAKGAILQGDQAIRDAANMIPDRKLFNASLDALVASSINPKVRFGLKSGEMPGSAQKFTPLAPFLEGFAKSTDEAERLVVSDALLARSALDDIKQGKPQSAFNDKTPAELEQIALRGETDAKLSPFLNEIKNQYKSILDYKLERGMISQDAYNTLRLERPNYVHMSKNTAVEGKTKTLFGVKDSPTGIDSGLNKFFSRSEEVGGGVQSGATADPVRELAGEWYRAIREAEVNDVKKTFLEYASNNAALSQWVKQLPTAPKDIKNSHGVMVNGKQVYYHVKDEALNTALQFAPNNARSAIAMALSVPKRLKQMTTTGILAPGFAPVSSLYDTMTSIINLEKGMSKGVINEGLNYLGSPVNLGRFDPTILVEGVTGSLRLGADKITEALADGLTNELMSAHSPIVNMLGTHNAQALRDMFAKAYYSSVKAEMDRYGALTTTTFNSGDPTQLATGMADLAPTFSSQVSQRAFEEAMQGGASFAEGLLRGSQNMYEQSKSNQIAKLYSSIIKTIHEGPRYATFATNLPKYAATPEGKKLLASQVRRASGDVGQIGNSAAYQDINHVALYLNSSIQPMAQIARRFIEDPVHTLINTTTLVSGLIALRYGYAALDPANAQRIAAMSDEEKSRMAPTFGGLDIPIEPALRVITAPLFTILDQLSGVNEGQVNPEFASVVERWLDRGEEFDQALSQSVKASVQSAGPVNTGMFPAANAGMVSMGLNPGMSRYTDSPQLIKSQNVSALGGDGDLSGDALSSTTEALINELAGGVIAHTIRAAQDFDRAVNGGKDAGTGIDVALSRLTDETVKGAGPLKGMLFGNYDRAVNFNDTTVSLWFKKVEGIEKATNIYNQDIMRAKVTGLDPRFAMRPDTDVVPPELQGTMLMPLGALTVELNRALRNDRNLLSTLTTQTQEVKNQIGTTIEERNRSTNDWNMQRKEVIERMMLTTKQFEEAARRITGDEGFTFQNFDPEKYKEMPYPPVAPEELPMTE